MTVYQELGQTKFVRVSPPEILVASPLQSVVDEWAASVPTTLSRRNLISYELYASSRFESSSRARFLLLIMAVEAMATQESRSDDEIALLKRLEALAVESELPKEKLGPLIQGLKMLRKRSIGRSCEEAINMAYESGSIIDPDAVAHFRACYRIRGKIVHGGTSPDPLALTEESNRLESTVRGLLAKCFTCADGPGFWSSEFTATVDTAR